MTALVALDWGTSSLRIARLDAAGQVLDERHHGDRGLLHVPAGGFARVFADALAGWQLPAGTLCLASGMVGSRQGWIEAPYCPCPAGLRELAARVAWVPDAPGGLRLGIVPGLSAEHADAPDVMRGEETQVLGALDLLGQDHGLFVLPGTHSKWVRVENGRIAGFSTFMTGEVYGLLRRQSILARTLPADDGPLDEAAFLRGVAHADAGPLLHTAFSVRTLALFGRLPADALPSYLSGLVIGEELRAQPLQGASRVTAIGADALTRRYRLALQARGVPVDTLGDRATWRGLWALATILQD